MQLVNHECIVITAKTLYWSFINNAEHIKAVGNKECILKKETRGSK